VRYISTRGEAPVLGFEDVLLAGLARDGGLYVPEDWPEFSEGEIDAFAGRPYGEVALEIMKPFVAGAVADRDLAAMIADAYAGFDHPAVAPLRQLDADHWLLELFHGPTLAFKDVAMQVLARLMDHVLRSRGARATIVGATSGDTGGAAIEAFRGIDTVDVFILHPHGRVSEVQRRQMTTVPDGNIHNIALDGTFDDCQAIVKALFNHHDFRDRLSLAGVNSINWVRIMAQIVYYFTSAVALGAPSRAVSFTVPTGNFGDVFAGYAARRMGLPVRRLVVATNVNDILARTIDTGRYEVGTVVPTTSPSMDIQVSSNFERLLFDAGGRDPAAIRRLMQGLAQSGAFRLSQEELDAIRQVFEAGRTDEAATARRIAATLETTGVLADPHTAVGLDVAARVLARGDAGTMITLSTAHPAKFPDAVERACGVRPGLPPRMAGLFDRTERFTVLANDTAAVEAFIEGRARVALDV
jgi:threonine synthase